MMPLPIIHRGVRDIVGKSGSHSVRQLEGQTTIKQKERIGGELPHDTTLERYLGDGQLIGPVDVENRSRQDKSRPELAHHVEPFLQRVPPDKVFDRLPAGVVVSVAIAWNDQLFSLWSIANYACQSK